MHEECQKEASPIKKIELSMATSELLKLEKEWKEA